MSDATQDWVAMREAARAMPTDTPKRILTTNHPEVTDPAERERLGLDAPRAVPCPTCGEIGCCDMRLHPALSKEPSIVLTGDEMAAYDTFALAAAAVEAQAEAMQKANADYRAALERVSQHAARRNRPR